MLQHLISLYSLLAAVTSAATIQERQLRPLIDPLRCGNSNLPPPPPFITSENYAAHTKSNAQPLPGFTIPTYIHLVSTPQHDNITNTTVQQQITALTESYSSALIKFDVRNFTRTVNATWATANSTKVEQEMKDALRQGGYDSLNLYLLSDWNPLYDNLTGFNGTFGVCSYPEPKNITKKDLFYDGCIIQQYTLPGSPGIGRTRLPPGTLDEGKTAVHEVGHWLYLYHVFGPIGQRSDCIRDDAVFDTPLQFQASNLTPRGTPCPPMLVSCPAPLAATSVIGPDNVDNYMDYSADYCMTRFTPEQAFRMAMAWNDFRKGRIVV
jgi:hypothetical protein